MPEIIPAILETSFAEIEQKLKAVSGAAPVVQLDICDGVFTERATWPYITPPREGKSFNYDSHLQAMIDQEEEMPELDVIELEIDLMVANPKRQISDLLNIGPKRVIIHLASLKDPIPDLHSLARLVPGMVELGLAILPDVNISVVEDILGERLLSFVQCMGIEAVGVQGTEPNGAVLEKTCANLRMLRAKFPELPLSVDGGVNSQTVKALTEAGATRLVAGSAIYATENPKNALVKLSAMI
jgi:ribulose-phosphate 3-epimerase